MGAATAERKRTTPLEQSAAAPQIEYYSYGRRKDPRATEPPAPDVEDLIESEWIRRIGSMHWYCRHHRYKDRLARAMLSGLVTMARLAELIRLEIRDAEDQPPGPDMWIDLAALGYQRQKLDEILLQQYSVAQE